MVVPDFRKPVRRIGRGDAAMLAMLAAIWGLVVLAIDPVGDFPLNDDWSYGLAVKYLVVDGQLRFTDWQSIPLITQVLWGALFTLPVGVSFTALRFSTLVLGSLGLLATFATARTAGLKPTASAIIAGLILINPLFVSLSCTFMTDVPSFAFGMMALALLAYGLKHDRAREFWAGWVMVLLASLIRQPMLAIAMALVPALAVKEGLNLRWFVRAVLPATLVIFAVVVAYPMMIQATIGLPSLYHARTSQSIDLLGSLLHGRFGALKPAVESACFGLMTLGLWMLPLLVLDLPRCTGASTVRGGVAILAAGACAALALTVILAKTGHLMPLGSTGGVLIDFGTGIRSLKGAVAPAPRWLWWMVTAISAFGSFWILLNLARFVGRAAGQVRRGERRPLWPAILLLGTAALLYTPVSLNYGPWFDRYTIPVMALLGICFLGLPAADPAEAWAQRSRPACVAAALVLSLAYVGFAVASTHDYLDWNRQRWRAGLDLVAEGVSLPELDGGFEFNNFLTQYREPTRAASNDDAVLVQMKPDPHFSLAFSNLRLYDRVRELPVRSWLPLSPKFVLVLERQPVVETERDQQTTAMAAP
jgi:Dolichyl-phosphate-mannose-protein mannosyltransferase